MYSTFRARARRTLILSAVPLVAGLAPAAPAVPNTPPEYSAIAYFQRRLAEQPPLLAFPRSPADVPAWREKVAARLRTMLGIDLSVPAPLNPRLLDTRQRAGYRVELLLEPESAPSGDPGPDIPRVVVWRARKEGV